MPSARRAGTTKGLGAWALFDWANSPYPTVIITFVFAVYFQQGIVGDAVEATTLWGNTVSLSALAVAILGPICGAIADASGRRKGWLLACTLLTAGACAGLWFATPDRGSIWLVLVLVGVGNVGFELGMVFYNAMLPALAGENKIGRVSGWAWGLGYAGGLMCLVLALFGVVQADPPPFGLDKEQAEPVRFVALIVAGWLLLFAWPLFVFTPEESSSTRPTDHPVREGLTTLLSTVRHLKQYKTIVRFLIARMVYIDGLNTLFAFGGLYAAGHFGMEMTEVLMFAIGLNVTAGLGAFGFGWMDDRLGAKPTLIVSLVCLIAAAAGVLMVSDKAWFWGLGLIIGIFMGPIQSASRTMLGRMAPETHRTEMFGLYALSGKATAFLGPWLVALVTSMAGSQTAGMAVILVFLVGGLLLLIGVPNPGVNDESAARR